MKIQYFAIKDVKVGFKSPFAAHNEQEAVRMIENTMNSQGENELKMNAQDYQLYKIGEFCDQTGKFEGIDPEFVCNLIDYKKPSKDVKFEDLQRELKILEENLAFLTNKTKEEIQNVLFRNKQTEDNCNA